MPPFILTAASLIRLERFYRINSGLGSPGRGAGDIITSVRREKPPTGRFHCRRLLQRLGVEEMYLQQKKNLLGAVIILLLSNAVVKGLGNRYWVIYAAKVTRG
ncbi:hypothetical protein EVAR_60783_1 [Eumeta japonica]|uniref:Uncharacterized protein n=1 Tax=Eumeta variegata TaxID=151549 RepID=A0A4C1ZV86_EUMVA|nr:hypothetical protein EVAR_60783_1 [Eumeta japonica]